MRPFKMRRVEHEVQSKDTWQELRRNGLCCVTIYCVKVILFYIAPVQCSVCVLWTVQWKESRFYQIKETSMAMILILCCGYFIQFDTVS